jgi:hypothetical protein
VIRKRIERRRRPDAREVFIAQALFRRCHSDPEFRARFIAACHADMAAGKVAQPNEQEAA